MDYNKCELHKAKQRAMHSLNAARRSIAAECFSMCEDGRLQHTKMHHIFYNAPSLSALALLFSNNFQILNATSPVNERAYNDLAVRNKIARHCVQRLCATVALQESPSSSCRLSNIYLCYSQIFLRFNILSPSALK